MLKVHVAVRETAAKDIFRAATPGQSGKSAQSSQSEDSASQPFYAGEGCKTKGTARCTWWSLVTGKPAPPLL
jgi:hypothetical protein